jgi:hypothetical protein
MGDAPDCFKSRRIGQEDLNHSGLSAGPDREDSLILTA